jgi:probable phosphoglycerate mutase
VHLNALGRSQAQALATRLGPLSLSALVSSPLERACETAAPLAAQLGLHVEAVDGFIEFGVGDWTGARFGELEGRDDWRRFNEFSFTRAPGGELMLEVQQRAVAALLALRVRLPGRNSGRGLPR